MELAALNKFRPIALVADPNTDAARM